MADSTIDIIATRILVETQEATRALSNFDKGVNETTTNLEKVAQKMLFVRRATGRSIKEIETDFKKLNDPKGAGQFGSLGVNNKQIEAAGKLVAIYEKQLVVQKKSTAETLKAATAEERVAKAAEKAAQATARKAALPQNAIPAFVNSQFGDINAYIAQSQNKIEAWKRVVVASAKQAGVSFEAAGAQLKKMVSGTTVAPLSTALKQLGVDGRNSFQKVVDGANLARIAVGALVSMLLFQAIQAVTTFFKSASDQAKQMEETMYRLANAERILSIAGKDITLKGLEDGITRIQKLLPIFAREDIAQLIGGISIATQQLGYSEEQIISLAEAVALLNTRSVDSEDLLTTFSHVLPSLLGKSSTGIAQLGISFNETEKAAAANTLGLLENGRTLQDLTDDELAAVKLAILMKNANVDSAESLALLNDFLESNSAKLQTNAAAWKDLSTTVGQFINNVLPNLVPFLEWMQKGFELQGVQKLFKQGGANFYDPQDAIIINKMALGIALTQKEYERLKETLAGLDDKAILKIFPDPSAIKDRFTRELIESLVDIKDTATGMPDPLVNPVDEEALKALEELDDKLRDIAIDAQQAREDLAVALSQKQDDLEVKFTQKTQDIDTEYIRKEEDAARDLQRKISDIERDAERERQRVLDNAREDEQRAEEDHQLKLWELKMRYLMDLEDALHARDARQIIRLQRQYELDKELLERKKDQEDEERQRSLEADLEDVEEKRKERLQEAQIEYQQKLADLITAKARELEQLNVWKEREEADLKVWYERELEEIDRQTQQKIERLLAGYIEEGKLHEEQQAAIHEIFKKYFGKNMALVDALVAYTTQAFAGMGALVQQGYQPFVLPNQDQGSQGVSAGVGYQSGFAEGGSVIATRPTRAMFGERGPELATFTPLNRNGRDVNKLFGDVSGGGEGTINLDILLSPDLEARIVENSMDGVANVLARVNRSKV